MSFRNAPEVKEIATRYINDYHQHLANVTIIYLFTGKKVVKKGKELLGETKLLSGLNAYLATRDMEERPEQLFVITISQEGWDLLEGNQAAREALIDHELQHCDRDIETSALSINPHDIEEFFTIVERHGPWMKDIHTFIEAAKRAKEPMLPFDIVAARATLRVVDDEGEHDKPASEESEEPEQKAASSIRLVKNRKKDKDASQSATAGE